MTKEEAFKIKADKFRGSGAIIRHHNPAYEGIVNSAFVAEQPPISQMAHHQFSNGRAQPIHYTSDTDTERSIGEVIIPMTTLGMSKIDEDTGSRKRSSNGALILDASKL